MRDKQTVLIVDDVIENIDILVNLLGQYDLVTATDAKSALNIVKEEEIDLILLDIMMPNMDGFEVCEILKNESTTLHIPIIFLSAKDKHKDIQKGFELGAVDYITKPFNPTELLSRVSTHLKLRAYEKDLEKRVTQELEKNYLTQQMIHQQSKQAALGELLMHIAHQWKQPLASLGSINLLYKTKIENSIKISDEDFLKKVEKTEELIKFMSTTVDTFRDFYQPSNTIESFSLTDATNNVLNIYSATLEYNNIKIYLHSSENENSLANENEFTQVIFSIINNSRDIFNLRKTQNPEIHIEIENKKVSISDNAGGVDESIINDIFEAFKSSTEGNGIGLYIAKEILEKNSATISVKNRDKGALFTIEFLTWLD